MTAPAPGGSGANPSVRQARASALWAAWGDALGFISELTDAAGLRRRTGGHPLTEPVAWRRRVGGRYGVIVDLPAGCYSDDTQLRLATGRAIGPHGFDVEAFAKVELPVWLAYALGGGRGTKAAATNLGRTNTQWFANTHEGWSRTGGNGAAMRIQPHVWHSVNVADPGAYLSDVLRNAVCTHAHPHGLVGAALHAVSLAYTMATGEMPTAAALGDLIATCRDVPILLRNDPELSDYWMPLWERDAGQVFSDAWQSAVDEAEEAARTAANTAGHGEERWRATLKSLRLYDDDLRGSGTLCAIAAVALGWCEERPDQALVLAANALGSDTDTIATMAGALFGTVVGQAPPSHVLDADLISTEAARLAAPDDGGVSASHRYPDLLRWKPPKSQADVLVRAGDRLVLAGLGDVEALADPLAGPQSEFQWQWLRSQAGQTMIVKRRTTLPELPAPAQMNDAVDRTPRHGEVGTLPFVEAEDHRKANSRPTRSSVRTGVPTPAAEPLATSRGDATIDVDRVVAYLEREGFHDRALALAVRRVAERGSIEQLIALTITIRGRLRANTTPPGDGREPKPG